MTIDKNKPLLQMNDLERARAWDDLSHNLDVGMLSDARAREEPLLLSVLVLHLPSGEERTLTYGAEYGDGECYRMNMHTLRSIRRSKLLHPGESLSHEFRCVTAFVVQKKILRP